MSLKKHITFIVNPISGTHNKDAILRLIENLTAHAMTTISVRRNMPVMPH